MNNIGFSSVWTEHCGFRVQVHMLEGFWVWGVRLGSVTTSHVARMNKSWPEWERLMIQVRMREFLGLGRGVLVCEIESYHMCEWVMTWVSAADVTGISMDESCRVTHINESYHTHERVMSHTWISHGNISGWVMSRHTYKWVISHTWTSHVTHMNKSREYQWMSHVTSHI